MKWLLILWTVLSLSACSGLKAEGERPIAATDPAQIGIVNHTGNYIYSASVNGAGGGKMSEWSAGTANICCATIPQVWYPGIMVHVRWNMPVGRQDVIKEKIVEVERYGESGSIYLHFFPNDEVRVVVSNVYPWHPEHPIKPPVKPNERN